MIKNFSELVNMFHYVPLKKTAVILAPLTETFGVIRNPRGENHD